MRMLAYVFETLLEFSEEVSDHSFVLRCLPKVTNTQTVMESQVYTDPRTVLSEQSDGFGNRIVTGYTSFAHKTFSFYATGLVMTEADVSAPEPAHPMFLFATPLTKPSLAIEELARAELARAGGPEALTTPEGVRTVARALCAAVHAAFAYTKGETTTQTTAAQAFDLRKGVCQDYSHVLVALLRSIGVPARYVTGLMVGTGASHAWVEAHDGVRWIGFDPTHDCAVDDRYLLFCTGRDFEDCPIERGVFRGQAVQTQTVSAAVGDKASALETSL